MEKYLEILEITKPHGLNGEMRAKYYCDDPNEIMQFDALYLGTQKKPVKLTSFRVSKNMVIVGLSGFCTIEAAQELSGEFIYIDREDVSLDENVWFIRDLIGLDVFDIDTDCYYGKVEEILQNAPVDVYCVRTREGKQLLFPAIPDVLQNIDLNERKILIRPLDGLFE
ncbi:MAG: ribosome maturation factor RimM [Oscillospiraceae bacterium]|nr:ribosome maturation factor RimM [Oscillospiraceae bacterium]